MSKLYKDKTNAEEIVLDASEQIIQSNEKIATLQGTIDDVSDVINNSKSETTTTDNKTMSADERYKSYINGLKNSLKTIIEYGNSSLDELVGETDITYNSENLQVVGVEIVSLKNNGDVYVQLSKDSYLGKKHGTEYKIGSNIVKIGVTDYGQDSEMIYMINDEGKFYYCKLNVESADSSTNSLEFKEITKLKNIINVENIYVNASEANLPFAVDIEGKLFNIDELI